MKRESALQAEIVKFYNNTYCLAYLEPRGFIFSVPNELGADNKIGGIYAKAMGLKAGVSDLVVGLTNGRIIFVELKTEIGKQSDKQKRFQQSVESLGHHYHICRSLEQFKKIIDEENN